MGLFDIFRSLLFETKKLELNKLPSQGLFYNDDFSIKIKKADIEDMLEYERDFDSEDLLRSIECIKRVVSKNTIYDKEYSYADIKSVDIIFVFLEIVKFTIDSDIVATYVNKDGDDDTIVFNEENFGYFSFDKFMKYYDSDKKEFIVDDYRFSLPSIGLESSLTKYFATKLTEDEIMEIDKLSYDFMFFLGGRNNVSFPEIDNLINIFNHDLDKSEIEKIQGVVTKFKGIVGHALVVDGEEIKSKIDLKEIWKN